MLILLFPVRVSSGSTGELSGGTKLLGVQLPVGPVAILSGLNSAAIGLGKLLLARKLGHTAHDLLYLLAYLVAQLCAVLQLLGGIPLGLLHLRQFGNIGLFVLTQLVADLGNLVQVLLKLAHLMKWHLEQHLRKLFFLFEHIILQLPAVYTFPFEILLII